MEDENPLHSLSEKLKTYLPQMKIRTWEDFAELTLEELLNIKDIGLNDIRIISRRLHLINLGMHVPREKLNDYYQRTKNLSFEQHFKKQYLKTSIQDFLRGQNRAINALNRAGIKTLEDLISKTVYELITIKGIGGRSLNPVIRKVRAKGYNFADE